MQNCCIFQPGWLLTLRLWRRSSFHPERLYILEILERMAADFEVVKQFSHPSRVAVYSREDGSRLQGCGEKVPSPWSDQLQKGSYAMYFAR